MACPRCSRTIWIIARCISAGLGLVRTNVAITCWALGSSAETAAVQGWMRDLRSDSLAQPSLASPVCSLFRIFAQSMTSIIPALASILICGMADPFGQERRKKTAVESWLPPHLTVTSIPNRICQGKFTFFFKKHRKNLLKIATLLKSFRCANCAISAQRWNAAALTKPRNHVRFRNLPCLNKLPLWR